MLRTPNEEAKSVTTRQKEKSPEKENEYPIMGYPNSPLKVSSSYSDDSIYDWPFGLL